MAKANPLSGASLYVPEGADVPSDVPDGVRLVGPGAPAVPVPVVPDPPVSTPPPSSPASSAAAKPKAKAPPGG